MRLVRTNKPKGIYSYGEHSLFILICVVVSMVLGIIIGGVSVTIPYNYVYLSFFLLLFFAFLIAWIKSKDPFSPFFIIPITYIIYYGAGIFGKWSSGIVGYIPPIINFYVLIGVFSYCVGIILPVNLLSRDIQSRTKQFSIQDINVRRLFILAILYLLLGLIALAILLKPTGYDIRLIGDVNTYRTLLQTLPGWLSVFLDLIKISAILLMVFVFLNRRLHFPQRIFWYFCILGIATLTLTTASRTMFIQLMAYWIILHHYLFNKWNVNQIVIWGSLGALIIGGLLYIRQFILADSSAQNLQLLLLTNRGVNVNSQLQIFLYYLIAHAKTGVETFTKSVMVIPASIPFQHGSFISRSFLTLLPGKQQNPSIFVTDKILGIGTYTEYPPTMLGGFYIDFGLLGIAYGVFLCGFFLSWIYSRITKGSLLAAIIYSAVFIEFLTSLYSMVLGSIRPLLDLGILFLSVLFIQNLKPGRHK